MSSLPPRAKPAREVVREVADKIADQVADKVADKLRAKRHGCHVRAPSPAVTMSPGLAAAAHPAFSHPVLSLADAARFEAALFGGDEAREWAAMQQAARAVAAAVLRDFDEIGPLPPEPRILVLAGKGHNGGDALLAAKFIHEKHPRARIEACLVFGERAMRPLALRAWRELSHAARGTGVPSVKAEPPAPPCDIILDGIFGFQFRPPVEPRVAALIARVNASPACLRAAVDLPSGLGTPDVFQADFTYATGIVKSPALAPENAGAVGRLRYIDLGFFNNNEHSTGDGDGAGDGGANFQVQNPKGPNPKSQKNLKFQNPKFQKTAAADDDAAGDDGAAGAGDGDDAGAGVGGGDATNKDRAAATTGLQPSALQPFSLSSAAAILTPAVLSPLRNLRSPLTDKRDYGHLFIVGGSRGYPGAVIMAALAALRSGAGLVTVFVPETMAAACAARAPEAMWVAWPETPGGGLAPEGAHLFRERAARATALLVGPGLGREAGTLALAADLAKRSAVPLVLDADALQPSIAGAGAAPRILTPHAGEFARITGAGDGANPKSRSERSEKPDNPKSQKNLKFQNPKFQKTAGAGAAVVVVLKGPVTRIDAGGATTHHSLFGGPVLARGGSGDLLAGLIGGLLAQEPAQPLLAACRGTVWHGLAADRLARAQGQRAVNITRLLNHLAGVLREDVPVAAAGASGGKVASSK
jgi:hydroxyethylthiazole kinase-like uncharacterized protein yjeF